MKFLEKDFNEEALNQGDLMKYGIYQIKWSTCCGMGFIKFCKINTSMKEDIRFNIKTGRQIVANEVRPQINQEDLATVLGILKSLKYRISCQDYTLYQSAAIQINKKNKGREGWEDIDIDNLPEKFILAASPKKKG